MRRKEDETPAMNLVSEPTSRGFDRVAFEDFNGSGCSLQKSSIVNAECIWLGVNNASPQVLASRAQLLGLKPNTENGWVPYPIPKDVSLTTRMHLTREQVAALLPLLQRFVRTGRVKLCKKDVRR